MYDNLKYSYTYIVLVLHTLDLEMGFKRNSASYSHPDDWLHTLDLEMGFKRNSASYSHPDDWVYAVTCRCVIHAYMYVYLKHNNAHVAVYMYNTSTHY